MKCLPLVLLVFVSFLAVVGCGNILFRGDLAGTALCKPRVVSSVSCRSRICRTVMARSST